MADTQSGSRKTLLSRFKNIMGERVESIDEASGKAGGKGKGKWLFFINCYYGSRKQVFLDTRIQYPET